MKLILAAATIAIVLVACSESSAPDLGADLQAGRDVFSANCAVCHGGNGQGGSAPALSDVLSTFNRCGDQIQWITLGSERHKSEVGPNYGDTGKTITGVMPSFESVLTERQIAQVAAFERSRFGGRDESVVLEECGL